MSFRYKICTSIHCAENALGISDVTGDFDPVTNSTGWGADGDHEMADVDSVYISIVTPMNETPLEINLDTSDGSYSDSLVSAVLDDIAGLEGTVWQDGIVQIIVQIQGETDSVPFNYKAVSRQVATCKVACCVGKLTAQARSGGCGCQDDYLMDAEFALLAIGWAMDCGNENKALANLKDLQNICAKRCKGCGC